VHALARDCDRLDEPGREPDVVALGARLGDFSEELEESRGAQDRERDVFGFDLGLLGDLRSVIAPLSGKRSIPTIVRARWCRTPAPCSAARRLRVEEMKNSQTAASAQTGALATSTTASAPTSASASPSAVTASTPVDRDWLVT
jgi:hypothetical protein